MLVEIENLDYPAGRVYVCEYCGTRVKEGQMHSGNIPVPHATVQAIMGERVCYPANEPR